MGWKKSISDHICTVQHSNIDRLHKKHILSILWLEFVFYFLNGDGHKFIFNNWTFLKKKFVLIVLFTDSAYYYSSNDGPNGCTLLVGGSGSSNSSSSGNNNNADLINGLHTQSIISSSSHEIRSPLAATRANSLASAASPTGSACIITSSSTSSSQS